MRQSTKAVVCVLSLGVLASSYSLGLANANEGSSLGGSLSAAGSTSGTTSTDTGSTATESTTTDTGVNSSAAASEPTASATASASASNSATPSSTTNKATTKSTATPTATASVTPTKTATPTATATPTPTPTKTATGSSAKQTGDAIYYKYGTVQLAVTKSGGKISSIDVVVGTTRGREYAGVISELVPAAVSANGSNFGNYSGATFTTEAFKSALESALAKF